MNNDAQDDASREPTTMTSLPTEILLHIFLHLDKQDLTSARQVCKSIKGSAEELLFASIASSVFADPIPVTRMRNLLQSTNLTNLVKSIRIEPDLTPRSNIDDRIAFDVIRLFGAVLDQVFAFPELRTARLDFCQLPERYLPNHFSYETPSLPAELTTQFFISAWHDATGKPREKTVKKLELSHILPTYSPGITKTSQFRGVMQGLEELWLSFHHWTSSRAYRNDADYPSYVGSHYFMDDLGTTWLGNSPRLQRLHLQFKKPAGLYPKLDLSDVVFPRLAVLELCNVLVTEDLVHWLAKTKTLGVLRLISCSVVTWMRTRQAMDTSQSPIYGATVQTPQMCTFARRWVDIFDKLRASLPNLKVFEMGELQESTFPQNAECAVKYGLFPSRYRGYVEGYTCVAEDDFHGMLVGRDAAVLVALWKYTGQEEEAKALEEQYRWEVGYEEYMFGSVAVERDQQGEEDPGRAGGGEWSWSGGEDNVDMGELSREND